MSMELMVKAMNARVGNPLRKLVLIKLADNANDQGECWPSYQHIADQCEIGRSTVKNHIRQLEKMGLLVRVFRRDGELNKTNLYRLNLNAPVGQQLPEGRAAADRGVGQELTEGGAGAARGGGAGADPRTSHSFESVIEPVPPNPLPGEKSARKKRASAKFGLPDLLTNNPHGVSEQVLRDWLAFRAQLKAPASQTVWSRLQPELAKCVQHGISADDALAEAMAAGWRGLRFNWLQRRLATGLAGSVNSRDNCGTCGQHMDSCTCWAENIHEDVF